ncbi:MAG: GDSL family lipase [Ruminococcus sp.]|nr:GDSL family lipase [Ruminococcus sp.]
MSSKFWKRLTGALLACAMALPTVSGDMLPKKEKTVSAAGTNYHFDFGGGGTAGGYTGVSATTGYNKSTGYGFANTANVKNVGASGSGALSDAVQFTNTSWSNTFNVDLPNGLYRVNVTLGNTNRTSVVMEGMLQIINMTGNNATDSILIPITDGQLNIMATNGKAGYAHTMSALDIEWVSGETTLPPTIWMCGDSTVCNYYPKATSGQAGWGQVLDQYVDPSWQVRNMAASGQFAKGFVDAGQFAPILKYGKQGDIYIISIGINDTNYSNATEYKEVVTSMVQQAKAKGMQVILVKQQGRASDVNRNPLLGGRWFGGELDAIGAAEGVQVIDLFTLWQNHTTSIGYDATLGLYCSGDDLHPNRKGAMKLAELASSQIDWSNTGNVAGGAEIEEGTPFLLRNSNSGLYLSVEGTAEQGTNVAQTGITGLDEGRNLWKAEAAEDGYYRLYSCANDSMLLDVTEGKNENGTNIAIWGNSGSDAQLFKFIPQADGSYVIATKASDDKRCADVINAETTSGANIRQWERNGHACQAWFLEKVNAATDEFTPGDVNEDGVINAFDVAIMKKMLSDDALTRRQKRTADANADFGLKADDCKMVSDFVLNRGSIEPSATGNRVYYAVDQAYYSGVEEDYNLGYVSDAYLNLDNKMGSFAEWSVTVPKDGNFLCTFLIANGSANNRTMKIEVNNEKDYWMQDFLTTGAWTTWQERGIVLPLKAGKNIIRTTSATAEGGPNIDYLRLEWTDEPIAGIYNPTTTPETPGASGKTIYIAGDSTVQTYNASYAPQQGWGAFLGNYLNGVNVSNHAIAGRSSKSFYDNGRLDTILNEIKPGDYLFVQFGINDAAYNKAERYAPTCGSVPGTDGSFEFYMAKYIEGAKAKGATPVLVTTVIGLKSYDNNSKKFVGSYTNYCDAMKKCAAYYKIPCIDLNTLMVNHYNSIGYNKAYNYHMISTGNGSTDQTHFTETGANAVAGLVANAIKGLGVDISSNVK